MKKKGSVNVNENLIANGQILLCSGNGFVSGGIEDLTGVVDGEKWSHVAVVGPDSANGDKMIYESTCERGVSCTTVQSYLNNYQGSGRSYDGKIYLYELADPPRPLDLAGGNGVLFAHLGWPYSRKDINNILIEAIVEGKTVIDLETDALYCAMLAALFFGGAGLPIALSNGRNYFVPCDFAQKLFRQVARIQ